ncbi:hypothetical protein GCM10009117_19870 [Gangjinia marincola]|uniref:Secretion system C-terminal sorting domain-containing protein n=2 Tax=Gangjinia marincola TaxID=578463 RepID=A0ABN1MI88_9FLAO
MKTLLSYFQKTILSIATLFFSFSVLAQQTNVLILANLSDNTLNQAQNVETQLESTNEFNVDIFTLHDDTVFPGLFDSYDVALLMVESFEPIQDSFALEQELISFMENGGGLITTPFVDIASYPILGIYRAYFSNSEYLGGAAFQPALGDVLNPNHPIMNGVNSFDGNPDFMQTPVLRNQGGGIDNGAEIIARWTITDPQDPQEIGDPLIVANENVGPANIRRVHLNFWPTSSDEGPQFWDVTTDGTTILLNSVRWVAQGALNVDEEKSDDLSFQIFPNPATDLLTINMTNKNDLKKVRIYNIQGQQVIDATTPQIDISNLQSGLYLIKVIGASGDQHARRFTKK